MSSPRRFSQPVQTPPPLVSIARPAAAAAMEIEPAPTTLLLETPTPLLPRRSRSTAQRLPFPGPLDDWTEREDGTPVNRSDRRLTYSWLKRRPFPAYLYTVYGIETNQSETEKQLQLDIVMSKYREIFLEINGLPYEAAKENFGRRCMERRGRASGAANVVRAWIYQPGIFTLLCLFAAVFCGTIATMSYLCDEKFNDARRRSPLVYRTTAITTTTTAADAAAAAPSTSQLPCYTTNTSQLTYCPRNKTVRYRVWSTSKTDDFVISAPLDDADLKPDLLNFFCYCWLTQNEPSTAKFCNLPIVRNETWKYAVYLRDDFALFFDPPGLFITYARYKSNILSRTVVRYIAYWLCY